MRIYKMLLSLIRRIKAISITLQEFYLQKNQGLIERKKACKVLHDRYSINIRPRNKNLWQVYYSTLSGMGGVKYIPNDLYYCCIDTFFNRTSEARIYDDKNMYDLYFHDTNLPLTICRVINKVLFDANYNKISLEEAKRLISKEDSVIIKPSIDSDGGSGISFWDKSQGLDQLDELLNCKQNCVVQRLVQQHEVLNSIYPYSLNTIRILTLFYKGECRVLSCVLRMGNNKNRVDNAASGGLFCGIKDNGQLKDIAYNKLGESFETHPCGGGFAGIGIPNLSDCKQEAIRLSNRFSRVSKLISWDFSVDVNGNPILIEANLCYGDISLHQLTNGTVFGDLQEEIIQLVFSQKKQKLLKKLCNCSGTPAISR